MRVIRHKSKGFTLIEAAVIILLLSIALIPVIKLVSNSAGDQSAAGVLTGASGGQVLSKEMAVANTIMEKALAGDTSIVHPVIASAGGTTTYSPATDLKPGTSILSFNANGDFGFLDPDGAFLGDYTPPASTASPAPVDTAGDFKYTYPKYEYEQGIYYQWVLYDSVMQLEPVSSTYKSYMPKGNSLIKAVLKVYTGADAATKSNAQYSVSTYFFKNTADSLNSSDDFDKNIGVILVFDVSLSMKQSNFFGFNSLDFDFLDPPGVNTPVYSKVSDPAYPAMQRLPMRLSSGLNGYDPYAIASPYLAYRPTKNDLYFAKSTDNPLTPYDERYNPCFSAQSGGTIDLPDLPSKSYPYASSDTLETATGTNLAATCTHPVTPHLPPGGPSVNTFADQVLVRVPTLPEATIQAALQAGPGAFSDWVATNDPNSADIVYGDNCNNVNNIQTSNCIHYSTSGSVVRNPAAMYDRQDTEALVAGLFGNPSSLNMQQATLSRIESARTAMLSFVETIENSADLVDNFRIGLIPFSTEVQNGGPYTYFSGLTPPNEVVNIGPAVGTSFTSVKDSLLRLNRACNDGTYSYDTDVANCPVGKQPFTLTGQTNLAQALYYAEDMFDAYDSANPSDKLDSRLVILLTDGAPTKSATAYNAPTALNADEVTHLTNVATELKNNSNKDIDVYSVGLLTGGSTTAQDSLNAIKNANADNIAVFVDSVADLTPVFESIAQQAERLLLMSMKDRYQYLEY